MSPVTWPAIAAGSFIIISDVDDVVAMGHKNVGSAHQRRGVAVY